MIKNVQDLVEAVGGIESLRDAANMTDASSELFKQVRSISEGYSAEQTKLLRGDEKIGAPLVISFHPKLSLLNNNIQEVIMAQKIAESLGMTPLWIPYTYDTGFKTGEKKITSSAYAFFEGEYIDLRSSQQIRGNLIKLEKAINKKELNVFMQKLEKLWLGKINWAKAHFNQYDFGHHLFPTKLKLMGLTKKELRNKIQNLKKMLTQATNQNMSLGHSLAKITHSLLIDAGINLNLAFIDDIFPELLGKILEYVISTQKVKNNPQLLEGFLLHFNQKNKVRTPIDFTGDSFLCMDASANRLFDGGIDELVEALKNNEVIPTGMAQILVFSAIGCNLTIGGTHTQEYYPEYISATNDLLEETPLQHSMKLFSYGDVRFLNGRSITDMMSASRVLEAVGSRAIAQSGKVVLPNDVVDNLQFLAGNDAVPVEYEKYLGEVNPEKKTSLKKLEERFRKLQEINQLTVEELMEKQEEIKKLARAIKFEDTEPMRIKIAIENLVNDSAMRLKKMEETIELEQHLLGGTIAIGDHGVNQWGEFWADRIIVKYNGLLNRHKRVPTLLEYHLYGQQITEEFTNNYELVDESTLLQHVIGHIESVQDADENEGVVEFTSFEDVYNYLIPVALIPESLK